jgi:hypothetical protein
MMKNLLELGGRLPLGLGLASLVLGLATVPAAGASATGTAASAQCKLTLGSVNSAGGHVGQLITATTPPTAGTAAVTPGRFAAGAARLSGSWIHEPNIAGLDAYGNVVLGSSMYGASYRADLPETTELYKIGGGWDKFTFYEESWYDEQLHPGTYSHTTEYGLRNDGVLFRWRISTKGWVAAGSYPGFSSVKTMALISQTRTYDTFLANTRSGALYTIRIPLSSPLKPIVKQVRGSTWQAFDQLVAERCGGHGTLLLAIDKDTKSGYLYAVGRANGTATVINGLGKVPAVLDDPVAFRWTVVSYATDPLNGD